jgi:hypothetical protein
VINTSHLLCFLFLSIFNCYELKLRSLSRRLVGDSVRGGGAGHGACRAPATTVFFMENPLVPVGHERHIPLPTGTKTPLPTSGAISWPKMTHMDLPDFWE